MPSCPIISWQIDGETMETVTDFIFLDSRITAGDDCSHEIKGCLLLGSEAMTSLNSILKSWDITLPIKVWYSQSYGLSSSHIWIWELDHKKGWQLKYWCFWTGEVELFFFNFWSWRRPLRVPWTPRRSNHSILKEINTEYSLEGLMLKLNLQFFDHVMWRADSLEKTLMLGKIEGRRIRGQQRTRWLDGITDLMDVSLSKLRRQCWTGKPGMLQSMGSQRVGYN